MKSYFFTLICFIFTLPLWSQGENIGFGFRAGISLASLNGPSELDASGNELESNKMSSGFHIGLMLNYKFTDIMGLRAELLYSQRGTDYTYEGPSYFLLGRNSTSPITLTGTRVQTTNVSNTYLDIPLVVYYKIGYFEIQGGLNTGILLSSTAGGSIEFDGRTPNNNPVVPFEIILNHNYLKDGAGGASTDQQAILADGFTKFEPTITGAYYDFTEKDKSLYKTLDLGITAGLSYFLNDGLFLGVKYIHGLGDVDNNEYDISLKELNANGTYVQRSDINKSHSWQFSVGFTF